MINSNKRFLILHILIAVLFVMLFFKLFQLQVIDSNKYKAVSESKNTVNLLQKAPRGEIYDRYGKPLVTNRECYSVSLVKTSMSDSELNNVIYKLIRVIEDNGQEISDTFPVSENVSKYTFENIEQKEKWFEDNKMSSSMSPRELVDTFAKKYGIGDLYSTVDLRKIVGIRYEAKLRGFSELSPYNVIDDANVEIVAEIKERGDEFVGVEITNNYVREYKNGNIATHILGRVGKISAEEYEKNKDSGYGYNDIIGKQGIEKAAEEYLRGHDGIRGSEYNIGGESVEIIKKKDVVPGSNIILTIDTDLQRIAEQSLARTVTDIQTTGYEKHGADADSGAAVVIDVRNGDVLALASYPTYDLSQFSDMYSELANDTAKPLWNRAVSGTYAPGSTFKPLTAIAALETGALKPNEKIETKGVYSFYNDYRPKCWIWQDYRVTHGNINVSKALEISCNYFFCEAGRRIGIDTLSSYASRFGLGEYTGIELPEETKGYAAGPDAKKAMVKNETEKAWFGGDTIQAAIGQSYNLFTPVQLANYAATIANGGTRYKVNLIKSVRSGTDRSEMVSTEPVVSDKINLSAETIEAVKLGMRDVVDEGSARTIFGSYPIEIAGKTGTAQIGSKHSNNALFIAFAPFDSPEIAVAVVLEHGVKGANAAYVARDIFDYYFGLSEGIE